MAKLESNLKNMVIVLAAVALIASFLLASVYSLTEEPIKEAKAIKQQNAIKEVLPEFDKLDDALQVNGLNVYKAYKNGSFVGAAIESFSTQGYGGEIRIMVGFDKNGLIYNYSILEQKETPGLGSKMVDWFKSEKGNRSILNRDPSKGPIRVTKDGGDVDAISGSTITSRAFLQAVMNAYNSYADNPDAPDVYSSATQEVQPNDQQSVPDSLQLPADSLAVDSIPDGYSDATTQATTAATADTIKTSDAKEVTEKVTSASPVATAPVATPAPKRTTTTAAPAAATTVKTSAKSSTAKSLSTKASSTKNKTTDSKEEKSDIDSKLQEKQRLIEEARKQRDLEAGENL